jgi:ribosomal protein S18 acetylase RimI-like enzyme
MINEEVQTATVIRTLREEDIEAIVDIDASASHRRRPQYFRSILERSARSPMHVSLVAEYEGLVAGYLLASVYYGEYGIAEPTASIDAIGVRRETRRTGIAHELMQQLRSNLAALGVTTFRTEVSWSSFDLLGFLRSEGFAPAQRLCLELKI